MPKLLPYMEAKSLPNREKVHEREMVYATNNHFPYRFLVCLFTVEDEASRTWLNSALVKGLNFDKRNWPRRTLLLT